MLTSQKGFAPIIFILGILLASGIIVGGSFYIKNSVLPKKEVTPANKKIEQTPNNSNAKLSLFYDTSMLGKDKTKYYKADIDGQNKTEISIDNKNFNYNSGSIGPVANGMFLGQLDFHNLQIAPAGNPTGFKNVIKVGEKELISGTVFSKDATKIAYTIADLSSQERSWKLYIADIDGTNRKEVSINPKISNFSLFAFDFSANKVYGLVTEKVDGNKTKNNLGVIDVASGVYKNLVEARYDLQLGPPFISPDFKHIYMLRSDLNEKVPELDDKILEVGLEDGKEKILFDPTNNRIHLRELRLAPDGKSLAFQYEDDTGQVITTEIYLFDLVTGKSNVLVDKATYPNINYLGSWSPDGKYLWFSRRTVSIADDTKNPGKYNNTERNIFENYAIEVDSKKVNLFHKDTATEPIRITGWLAE